MIDETRFIETETLRIHETKGGGSYGIKILETGKTVACAYIKPTKKGYFKLYRVFVPEERRGEGLGDKIMQLVLHVFGDKDIHLSAYPNRISDYEERKEYYIKKLFEFYEKYGFARQGTTHVMIRYTENVDVEDLFE